MFIKHFCCILGIAILCWQSPAAHSSDIVLISPSISGTTPVKSWKALRDDGVIKQNFDYSCGAASLATVMSFYGKDVTEKEVMDAMGKTDNLASFEDMANVLPKFGFVAQGIALSFDQLTKLKIPVVAYLQPERDDHFTVIRGISDSLVWIGDPSWGNRVLTKARFLEMWQTREDEILKGKILLIQPAQSGPLKAGAFDKPKPLSLPNALITQRQL